MKIPILLEDTGNLKIASLYRHCSRCSNLVGPYYFFELLKLAAISYCETCTSVLSSKKATA